MEWAHLSRKCTYQPYGSTYTCRRTSITSDKSAPNPVKSLGAPPPNYSHHLGFSFKVTFSERLSLGTVFIAALLKFWKITW